MAGESLTQLMTTWRLSRWLLFYLAMALVDAAVVVAVVATV